MKICRQWIAVRGQQVFAHEFGFDEFCFDVNDLAEMSKIDAEAAMPDNQDPTIQ